MLTAWHSDVGQPQPELPPADRPDRPDRTDVPPRVLFVEDDQRCRERLARELSRSGCAVLSFADADALDRGADADVIVIVDWGLSLWSVMELLLQLRHHDLRLPVTILNGRPLAAPSDLDLQPQVPRCVDKPELVEALVQRLKRAMGATGLTAEPAPATAIHCGKLLLRPDISRAYWDGVDVGLTLREFNVVHLLVSSEGRFTTYRSIYDRMHYVGFVAGSGPDGYRSNVRSTIKRIRTKFRALDPAFAKMENFPSVGYRWQTGWCRAALSLPGASLASLAAGL